MEQSNVNQDQASLYPWHPRYSNGSNRTVIQHHEGSFCGSGGLSLYYQSWHPPDGAQAVLILVHGLGGHSGLFGNIVQRLVPQGYAVYALDQRGHGRSPGQRGYIRSWSEFRDDLRAFVQLITEQAPDCPLFLLGHSLGAVIALDYALRFPEQLQGLIATAPAVGEVGVSPFKLRLGQLLSRSWPRFALSTGIDAGAGSRDEAVNLAYAQDPLRHTLGTARLATEFLATLTWVQAHVTDLRVPVLILHGDADRVALPEGSRLFFERITFPDKERCEYPGGYHEVFNDINYEEVLTDLEHWLKSHLPN